MTFRTFIGLIVVMDFQVILEAANFSERFFAVCYVANEQLVHPQGLWIFVVGHCVETIVDGHHIVFAPLLNYFLVH